MDGAPSRPTDPPSCASTTILRADVPPILTKSPSGILGCMGITTFVAQAPQRVAPSIILDGCGCNFSPLPPKYLPHHKACGGPAAPRGRSLTHSPLSLSPSLSHAPNCTQLLPPPGASSAACLGRSAPLQYPMQGIGKNHLSAMELASGHSWYAQYGHRKKNIC
jgi:hypothetical protein